jgi:hypothetical protein
MSVIRRPTATARPNVMVPPLFLAVRADAEEDQEE